MAARNVLKLQGVRDMLKKAGGFFTVMQKVNLVYLSIRNIYV